MPADNGSEVKCEVTSPTRGSPKVTSATLSVLFAPREVSVWASPSTEVEVGQLVTLSCSTSSSNPKANITWRSGDAMLQGGITYSVPAEFGGIGTRSEFLLKAVAEDNGKAFMCEAENGLGTTIHKKITLSILQPPSLTDDPATTHSSWVDLGKSGHLACHARAAPPPNFTWTTEDTHNIETSEKYIIHKPELLDGLMLWASVLEVVNVTRQDYGEYQCSATNDLGTDSTWLTLKPPTRPHPPTNLTIVNVSDVSVVLGWTPNPHAGMPLNFTVKYRADDTLDYQYEDTDGSSTGVSVTGLSPGRKYISSVRGRNDHGNSDYVSPKIPVTTLGTAAEADGSGNQHLTSPLLLVVVVSTTALLVLNVILILCYLRQYKRRNKTVKSASSTKITSLATQRNTPASSQEDQHHHILMSLITDSTKIPKGYQDGHHDTKALDQNINSVCSTSPTRKKHRISQKSSAIKWNGTTRCKGKMPNNAKVYTQNNHTKIDSAFLHNQLVGNGRMSIHNKLKTNTKETTSLIPKCKVSGLPQIQLRNSGLDDDQISESSNESTDTAIFCDVKTSSQSESGIQQQRHSHIPNEHDTLSYVQLIRNELHQQAAAQQQLKQDKFVKFLPECTTEMLLHNNIAQPYSLDNHQQPNYHQACNSRGSEPVSNYDSSNPTIKATVKLTTVQRQQDKPALGHNPTTTATFSPQHQPPCTSSKAQLSHLTPEMSSKTQQQQLLPPSTFRVKKCLQQPAAPTNTQQCHLQPDLSTRAQKHKLSNNSPMRVQLCHLPPSPTQAEHRNQPPNSANRLQNHSLPPSSLTKAQHTSIPPNLPTKSQDCHQPPYLSIRTKNTLPPAPQKKQHYSLSSNSPTKIKKDNLSFDTSIKSQYQSPFKSPSKNKHSIPTDTPTRIKHRPPPVPKVLYQHCTPPTPPKLHHRAPPPSPSLQKHHPPTIKSNLEHPSLISTSSGWPCPPPSSPFLEEQMLPPSTQSYQTQCSLSPDPVSLLPLYKSDCQINTVPTTSTAHQNNFTFPINLSHEIPKYKLSESKNNTNHGTIIKNSSTIINSSHHNDSTQKDDQLSKNDRNTYQGPLMSQTQSHAIVDDQAPVATSSPVSRARRSRFPDDFLRQKRCDKL
nr:uncharacterized protein LOC123766685 [Procambarus clarkii]